METQELLRRWRESLTEKERALHELAAVKLKKELNPNPGDGDNGSYFPEKSHAFKQWLKAQAQAQKPQ
jgi:hypothetical protein